MLDILKEYCEQVSDDHFQIDTGCNRVYCTYDENCKSVTVAHVKEFTSKRRLEDFFKSLTEDGVNGETDTLYVQIQAVDKNSSDIYSRSIVANNTKDFDKAVDSFTEDVPFTKWYYEIQLEHELTEHHEEILMNHEYS